MLIKQITKKDNINLTLKSDYIYITNMFTNKRM